MPELTWLGKDAVRHHHQQVPYRPLQLEYTHPAPGPAADAGGPTHRLVHGDNLEALKSLLPEFEGRVKCVYIDPPYNTGNEGWAYNDNVSDPALLAWLGQVVGPEGDDLSRHDKWLCMMYPRLKLLHRLLREDGVIFVSIDDNEVANLRLVMDEIWGTGNFVETVIWQKNYSPKNSAKHFSSDHEFILVYAKNGETWRPNLMTRSEAQNGRYKNPDNDPRGPWKPGDLSARNYYSLGTYAIQTPSGRVISGPPKGRYWVISGEKLATLDKEKRIWWGKDGSNSPSIKRFLSEVQSGVVPQTLWFYAEVGHTQDAKKEVNAVMHDVETFATPKPTRLVERILELATDADSIVLDSFAGSGTTGHAVLKLNARDGGRRQCLLIEREAYAETLTAERLRRVMAGYGSGAAAVAGTGGAFGFYTLGAPLLDPDTGLLAAGTPWAVLAPYVWRAETGRPLEAAPVAPLLGRDGATAYYLHYDPAADSVLDRAWLRQHGVAAPAVVYADACLLDAAELAELGVAFRKLPRDLRAL